MNAPYEIRLAAEGDEEALRAIRNHAIEHTASAWTSELVSPEAGRAWLAGHIAGRSCYVAEAGGEVAGFASWSPWRPREGYRHTVEDSVYLTAGHRGRGLGSALLKTLIGAAADSGAHVMMACIEAGNAPSVALHRRLGFELVGTAREVGTKFGRWLDLTMMSRPL
jgi:phosphinothricin acetyltransferase